MNKIIKEHKNNSKGNKILSLLAYWLIGLLPFIATSFCFGFSLEDFGDFSSRSTLLNGINQKDKPTQEQKDLMKERKLAPTHECLFQQIKKGNYDNVKLLLESKVNPNKNYYTEYATYVASKENKFEILKLLVDDYGAKLNRGFNSELYEAVKNKNSEMAKYLIEKGAKVNYMDSLTNNTILYMSLKNKMYDISTMLIEKGAKPDRRSLIYIKKHKMENLIPEDKR